MKSNTFNYSLLAVGVATLMGLSTGANAAVSGQTKTDVDIINVATAKYNVAGVGQEVTSNSVKITVSEQVSFSLTQDNDKTVAPNGFVVFEHRLTNEGNRKDNYTITVTDRTDDTKQFDLTNSTITYRIYTDGDTPSETTGILGTISTTNPRIPLESNQFAIITVKAKTNGNKGGDTQNLDLTATGTALATNNASVVNIDKSTTKLPTFSIVKSVTDPLDLNNNDDTATYQITIKNPTTTYSADATNIIIDDILPAGLIISTPVTASATSARATADSSIGTIDSRNNGFTLNNANLKVGGTITITLIVKRAANATIASPAINHVKVTDDLDDNADTVNTIVDSTNSSDDTNQNFYPVTEQNYTDGTAVSGTNGDDSTQPLTTLKRALTLTQPTEREIAPTTGPTANNATSTAGQVTHQTIITNNGQNAEGNKSGELTFTLTDSGLSTAVNLVPGSVKITYTSGGTSTTTAISPTTSNGTTYDIFSVLPSGIAPNTQATISYNVLSNNAPLFTGSNSTTETTVVTLLPAGAGAPATAIPAVTDTTTVRGITLAKSQLKDAACNIAVNTTTPFITTNIDAEPGQCVIYQIVANNTFTTNSNTAITNLVISDLLSNFSNRADYVESSAVTTVSSTNSTISVAANKTATDVTTTVNPLAATNSATLRFKIKIKTDAAP